MTDKPINLRLRRKQRARDEKRTRGDSASAASGISRADQSLATAVTDLETRRLEAHRLKPSPSDDNQ